MFLLILFYLALPILQIYLFISGQFGATTWDILNFTASILAVHWLLANVLMSSKIPLLQKVIPYDQRIRFHIFSSLGIVAAVLYHAIFKLTIGFELDPVTLGLAAALGLTLAGGILWIPVPGLKGLRTYLLNRFSRGKEPDYDRSKQWHGYFILALGLLIIIHITGAGLFVEVPPVSALLYFLLYGFSSGSYLLSRTKLFRTESRVLSVEDKQGIITIRLQPERKFSYRSGQFTFLETTGAEGRKEEHPFSFLSSRSGDGEEVSLAIRAVGDFTSDLKALKPGDSVTLRGSFGNFRPGREEALCFIASGIGTVPILSILKELHAAGDTRPIRLFLAVNDRNELPEREKIEAILSSMDNVQVNMMVYNEDGLRFSESFFKEEISDHRRYSYYLCSSPGVRSIVVDSLKKLGVRKSSIHFEAFSFA
ncbi:FAD-binding oxidoreductase [Spirochaeta isovalerica]|uniref:Putative ferric reductase n=1 Tax=Spirochaeta isovalerica TaxID=150 RepID=A0A841R7L7_9SPIO|nr:FAD-binding oxidoreductase [Spirochaeta isovalerica]MBB6479371.1 putative ferric reductase [Spirochaeta isovalerica]